ncbi:ferritin-like domain-containing protein [Algihabitans albus]|uniref:ferritin-like domain-containing protein n=1 Tax=Algihabitans albus TaxID=2164067 RepID=UPI000E5C9429|nr:ferritin-like domain-containing protein [Algihabitans albus]
MTTPTLTDASRNVLATADAAAKAASARRLVADWRNAVFAGLGSSGAPDRPARPEKPELLSPTKVPRRRINTAVAGRVALLHALAHIELNAVDLAVDLVARFACPDLPQAFFDDWLQVADEEGKHFLLLADRLAELGAAYGDLPAHDGLWQAAEETAHDLLARLAVVPQVLEARGLDVTPGMIAKLERVGDPASAAILRTIYEEEIGHVAVGRRWYLWLCDRRGLEPQATWHDLVRRHFRGVLKPPFNEAARRSAGLEPDDYLPLALHETSR